tara:strand:+ start:16947 stop:17597 length:651 start_codon:yes stop_codon:yes gene_type:complete
MTNRYPNLNPEKALIWRIVHKDNIPWILDNGLYGGNSAISSKSWVHIGNPELTTKRATHSVAKGPGGFLNDYVPFYFTPFSPMMKNIHSGYGGIKRRANDEIVILVSSLHHLSGLSIPFVFTDSHAYYMWANYYTELEYLDKIDWKILQARDFKRDNDDPGKFERYQAEALVHEHCPVSGLLGMICYTDNVKLQLDQHVSQRGLQLKVHTRKDWYF